MYVFYKGKCQQDSADTSLKAEKLQIQLQGGKHFFKKPSNTHIYSVYDIIINTLKISWFYLQTINLGVKMSIITSL